ncbi:MAG: orotate phosphoribosyltransferase [Bacteroidales bacterium]|nr:orotate phosphoribosyltransferase [Bacteroidales bacterium]MCL2737935.1 orotate phosphoribosyltransferase [Bacteroidales bacterium]
MEKTIARQLLDSKAVCLSPEQHFVWASGWRSPIYCDNRKLLSYPRARTLITNTLIDLVNRNFPDADMIAGVATGAIAWGALVAQHLDKPFVYIRPKPKDHGTKAQIEGDLSMGKKVVIVEDLISTGGSSLSAFDCILAAGVSVLGMVAIFSYNFDVARKAFENKNCELHTLTNYDTLIEEAVAGNYIDEKDLHTLKQWRLMPDKWGC